MANEPSSSEEHEPILTPTNANDLKSDNLQIHIEPVDNDQDDDDEILQNITNDVISDVSEQTPDTHHHTEDEEVQNLIPDDVNSQNISTHSDDFVDVKNELNESSSHHSTNDYVVVNVNSDDNKQQSDENKQNEEETSNKSSSEHSYSSEPEPFVKEEEPTKIIKKRHKAHVMVTWVPKNTMASELTVVAGSTVTVIHSDPIRKQIFDNPLALKNAPSGPDEFDKIISINSMHFTKVQLRNGKIGIVPSNILRYDENPISNIWTKVKIQHSYMAKEVNELTISTQERVEIYGIVHLDGMITAKRKNGNEGLIPYNFVEIPSLTHSRSNTGNVPDALSVNKGHHRAASSKSFVSKNEESTSRNEVNSHGFSEKRQNKLIVHHQQNSSLKFTIDESFAIQLNDDEDTMIAGSYAKENALTKKIKAISSSISTAIAKTLDPPSSQQAKSFSSTNQTLADENTFTSYRAPLQWRKVYVLREFNGTQTEIDRVYQAFISDKETRGRNESILSYDESQSHMESHDVLSPSKSSLKSKKNVEDMLRIGVSDEIEICGDASPEGWILARFVDDHEHKGFVPISYLQTLDEMNNHQKESMSGVSGIGAALEKHQRQQQNQHNNDGDGIDIRYDAKDDSTVPMTSTEQNQQNGHGDIDAESVVGDGDHTMEITRSQQTLPFHWPFSSYPVRKRTKRGKIIETVILSILTLIYVLPILIEDPRPDDAPDNYYIWWINLWLVFVPWAVIFILRMLEIWHKTLFEKEQNQNNKLYATLLFYIILFVYFFGLFAIVIEVFIHAEWIRDNSPWLFLATIVEIFVFIGCVIIIVLLLLFVIVWTFCCRISRNRWETRIEFYCCTRGEALKIKRFPRTQK